MHFDAFLRAHAFMKIERPQEIWEADTEDVRFVPLLGEMIAAALSRGTELSALTLNVSNVVVPTTAGIRYADVRRLASGGSITVFLLECHAGNDRCRHLQPSAAVRS